ncbi:MAG TPA: hypothetical protein GXZ26_01185 [Firmicutes bacterium]|jgi:hypothetical protein|nr:hypothetical protein [Bacillota bacterium]
MKRLVIRENSIMGFLIRVGRKLPRILPAVIGMVLFVPVISFFSDYFFPRVTVADWGTLEHGAWVKALALRDEVLIATPVAGEFRLLVAGGTKVQKDQAVAEVVNPVFSRQMKGEWREVFRVVSERLHNLERELETVEKDLAFLAAQSRSGIPKGERMPVDPELRTIKKNLLDAKLAVIEETNLQTITGWQDYYRLVRAEEAGVFSTGIDGWERITLKDLEATGKSPFRLRFPAPAPSGRSLEKGDFVGKIISGFQQTLLVEAPKRKNLQPPEEGSRCWLRIREEEYPVTFTGFCRLGEEEFWLFEEKSMRPELLQQRTFTVHLVYSRARGIRVPRSALHYDEGTGWKVYGSLRGTKKEIPVDVKAMDDRWAIVDQLAFGTPVFY